MKNVSNLLIKYFAVLLIIVQKLLFPIQLSAVTPQQTLEVNFSYTLSPTTGRAAGYIGSDISDISPSDTVFNSKWLALNLQLYSWILPKTGKNPSFPGIERAKSTNATYQVKLWSTGFIPSSINDESTYSSWENYVGIAANLAKQYIQQGYEVELDIWNEPEYGTYWSGAVDERYYQIWIRAYNKIKSISPDIKVAGPSSNSYNWTKNTFLPRAKAENVLPDTLTWHEIFSDIPSISDRVASMRQYLDANQMSIDSISINEYGDPGNTQNAGVAVQYIYELENSLVSSASRACWEQVSGGTYDCAPHINGLLDNNGDTRSVWWVYKYYANMKGNITEVSPSSVFPAIASHDSAKGDSKIMVSNIGGETEMLISASGLIPGKYAVKIESAPATGVINSPTSVSQYDVVVVSSTLDVHIPNLLRDGVYFVTLTGSEDGPTPTSTPPPSKPGDTDRDGDVDINDYNTLVPNFGTTDTRADFNQNGSVDIFDYNILLQNFGS